MTNRTQASRIIAEDVSGIVERAGSSLDHLQGRSFVLTGAGGMLGRYLVETVAWCNLHRFSSPCHLTGIVRRMPGPGDALSVLASVPGITLIQHDARYALENLSSADYLMLAATKGSPAFYLRDPIETMELNGSGLSHWLRLSQRLRSEAVLYFSSGEIYGTPDVVPTPETYVGRVDPASPRSVYAESKRYGEALCLAFYRSAGIPVKIVRPFQVFGPGLRADDGRAFPSFLAAAAAKRPITIESAGTAVRTFMYIADATVAFLKVLVEGNPAGIYNVGSPHPELTILQLAERIAAAAGVGINLSGHTSQAGQGSPARTCPDITRLTNDFGFKLRFSVDDLIERTLKWMQWNERQS